MSRLLLILILFAFANTLGLSKNIVKYSVGDSILAPDFLEIIDVSWNNIVIPLNNRIESSTDKTYDRIVDSIFDSYQLIQKGSIDNPDRFTILDVILRSGEAPFRVNKVEWVRHKFDGRDTLIIKKPLEKFSYSAITNEESKKCIDWNIYIEFPYDQWLNEDDEILFDTDKGIIKNFISEETRLKNNYTQLQNDYYLQKKNNKIIILRDRIWYFGVVLLLIVIVFGLWTTIKRIQNSKRNHVKELSLIVSESAYQYESLERKLATLNGIRMDTLNLLCNEYYEIQEFGKTHTEFFNEVEKHILSMRNTKQLEARETIINAYSDNIISRVRQQIPDLKIKDITFLTYLYSGYSPRAICIFTDLKLPNFYKRRSRLKEKILNSDAPDKEFFASKMDL